MKILFTMVLSVNRLFFGEVVWGLGGIWFVSEVASGCFYVFSVSVFNVNI